MITLMSNIFRMGIVAAGRRKDTGISGRDTSVAGDFWKCDRGLATQLAEEYVNLGLIPAILQWG